MSLSSLLGIARSALLAQKRAMEVTANNVANAQTPGYSRQRLEMSAANPVRTADGLIGRGVTTGLVQRSRDTFYDDTYRRESGLFSQSYTLQQGLRQIEDAIGEPSDVGLSAAIDRMFHSFSDLANDPSSPSARDLVCQAGDRLAKQLNQLDTRLTVSSSDAMSRLDAEVGQANELLRRIGKLNQDILASGGKGAVDLQDQRDLAIDQLSNLVSVKVVRHDDGTVTVMSEEANLVDRTLPTQLSLTGSPPAIGGSIGGSLDMVNNRVPALRAQLDQLAANLVSEVNTVHRGGYTATGVTGTDFFDPTKTTAGGISLTSALRTSSMAVAASGTNRAGDGSVALQLAQLGNSPISGLAGRSFRDFYSGVAASVGLAASGAESDSEVQQALLDQADQQRTAVSGVSVDEEMVNLMAQQQAYGAAAKIITMADEMMQTLLQTI
jgi:flagellar hook-associated protein 1 FlgK